MRNNTQNTQLPTYATLVRNVREVPDMLVAAQLSLRPLAGGEATPTTAEAQQMVGDACNLLRVALANIVEVTRNLPDFPLQNGGGPSPSGAPGDRPRDPRMSARADKRTDNNGSDIARPPEQCVLTQPSWRSVRSRRQFPALTDEQLDRLRRCANGNTLRFESADIVAALVAAGYATEGVGRVVTVTPEGHRYLSSHPA